MNELPPEILQQIYENVSLYDLLSLSESSKNNYNFIQNHWNELETEDKKKVLIRYCLNVVMENMQLDTVFDYYKDKDTATQNKLREKFNEYINDICKHMEPLYLDYNYEELTFMVKYVASPIGKRIVEKQSKITAALSKYVTDNMYELNNDINDIINPIVDADEYIIAPIEDNINNDNDNISSSDSSNDDINN